MKKILVPTDFSSLSDNALNYAVQRAKKTNADKTVLKPLTKAMAFHSTLPLLALHE